MEESNLFLFYRISQAVYYRLQFDKTCRKLGDRYRFKYNINAILSDIVYARILESASKRSTLKAISHFLEPPSHEPHDIYHALNIFGKECDLTQVELQCRKFVYCSDAGPGSEKIRTYNHMGKRALVVTQSIKKLRVEGRRWASDKRDFKRLSDNKPTDISNLPEDDSGLYYKDIPYAPHKLYQRLTITYSPKCTRCQKIVRDYQIERVQKMIDSGSIKKEWEKLNDLTRFTGKMVITGEGEAARIHHYLDTDKILEETPHDGLYVIAIDLLDDNITDILKVSEGRWYRSRALCLLLVLSWVWF